MNLPSRNESLVSTRNEDGYGKEVELQVEASQRVQEKSDVEGVA